MTDDPRASCRITAHTTLQQLAELRGKFGVTEQKVTYERSRSIRPVSSIVVTLVTEDDMFVIGRGEVEWEALDDAYARMIHRIGERLLLTTESFSGIDRSVATPEQTKKLREATKLFDFRIGGPKIIKKGQ